MIPASVSVQQNPVKVPIKENVQNENCGRFSRLTAWNYIQSNGETSLSSCSFFTLINLCCLALVSRENGKCYPWNRVLPSGPAALQTQWGRARSPCPAPARLRSASRALLRFSSDLSSALFHIQQIAKSQNLNSNQILGSDLPEPAHTSSSTTWEQSGLIL